MSKTIKHIKKAKVKANLMNWGDLGLYKKICRCKRCKAERQKRIVRKQNLEKLLTIQFYYDILETQSD